VEVNPPELLSDNDSVLSFSPPPPSQRSSASTPITGSDATRRPASAPANGANKMFESRGQKRKPATAVEEALKIMKSVADQPIPTPGKEDDSAAIFGSLVASRLRELEQEKGKAARRLCEGDIMSVFLKYFDQEK